MSASSNKIESFNLYNFFKFPTSTPSIFSLDFIDSMMSSIDFPISLSEYALIKNSKAFQEEMTDCSYLPSPIRSSIYSNWLSYIFDGSITIFFTYVLISDDR